MPRAWMRAQRAHAAPSSRANRAGFTLIELMVVITLIALLLGMGLGVFSRIDLADRVAVSQVQSVLRSAHNWSLAREAPARVVLDAKARTIRAEGLLVVGTWHFESFAGAFGIDAAQFGGELVPNGFQGQALSFAGQPSRSRVDIPIQGRSEYDFGRGFSVRCAIRPAGQHGGQLYDVGGCMGLETTDDGAIRAWFTPERVDEFGARSRGGRIPLATDEGLLPPDHWTVVEIQYDQSHFRILVDGEPAAEVAETAPVSTVAGPFVLSPGDRAFPGAIDSLVVSVVAGEDVSELPRGVTFAKGAPDEILFTADGRLDRARHKEPVRFQLEFDDGHQEPIVINTYGSIE